MVFGQSLDDGASGDDTASGLCEICRGELPGVDSAVKVQTILTAKEFLDAELKKYETWEQFRTGGFSRAILHIENGQAFAATKKEGVGRETLMKFLGGNWTEQTRDNVFIAIQGFQNSRIRPKSRKDPAGHRTGRTFCNGGRFSGLFSGNAGKSNIGVALTGGKIF